LAEALRTPDERFAGLPDWPYTARYLHRPDADAESRTADGWFRTGDVAVIGPDGFHRRIGRASVDLIKSGGFRIGAGEVEAALRDHPAVADAAVVGAPDADLGQAVVAYVIPAGEVSGGELASFVAERLSVLANAPRGLVGQLAHDDEIAIAADSHPGVQQAVVVEAAGQPGRGGELAIPS